MFGMVSEKTFKELQKRLDEYTIIVDENVMLKNELAHEKNKIEDLLKAYNSDVAAYKNEIKDLKLANGLCCDDYIKLSQTIKRAENTIVHLVGLLNKKKKK